MTFYAWLLSKTFCQSKNTMNVHIFCSSHVIMQYFANMTKVLTTLEPHKHLLKTRGHIYKDYSTCISFGIFLIVNKQFFFTSKKVF